MWVIYAVLAAAAYGAWALLLRVGMLNNHWGQILVTAACTEAVVILVVVKPVAISNEALLWGVLAGICAACGYTLFSMSMFEAKSALPVVIMSAYPVLVVILSVLAFGDVVDWTKWIGVALAVIGVILVGR